MVLERDDAVQERDAVAESAKDAVQVRDAALAELHGKTLTLLSLFK